MTIKLSNNNPLYKFHLQNMKNHLSGLTEEEDQFKDYVLGNKSIYPCGELSDLNGDDINTINTKGFLVSKGSQ